MIRLLLVRHGETAWNSERRLQGRLDIPLGDVGRAQAAALAPAIAREAPGLVVTSALRRTQDTADVLGVRVDSRDPRLDEASLGQWEGLYSARLREDDAAAYAAWRAGELRPPGAEGFDELTARVLAGVADAVLATAGSDAAGAPLLVVTHGGPARAFLRAAVGLAPARTVPSHPASLSVYDVDDAALRAAVEGGGDAATALTEPGVVRLRLYNYAPAADGLEPPD